MDPAVAPLARDCPLLSRARALAAFVGEGRALTAKGVLRRADIAPAYAAAGLPDPGRVVTAADVPALHRAWVAAQGAGLLVLGLDRAIAATPDGDAVTRWLGAVTALLRAESDDPQRIGATAVCRVALSVLDSVSGIDRHRFGHAVENLLDQLPITDRIAAYHAFRRGQLPETGALELLTECGAVDPKTFAITPLGPRRPRRSTRPRARLGRRQRPAAQDRPGRVPAAGVAPGPDPGRHHPRRSAPHRANRAGVGRRPLHVFTVDGIGYADPDYGLDGCGDEETITLASALPRPGATLAYRYDLGDCWDHTVLLEKVLPPDPDARPTCVRGCGNTPVEDWHADEPPPPRQFRPAEIDALLAELHATAGSIR